MLFLLGFYTEIHRYATLRIDEPLGIVVEDGRPITEVIRFVSLHKDLLHLPPCDDITGKLEEKLKEKLEEAGFHHPYIPNEMERLEFLNGNLKGVSQVLLVRLTRTQPISSWGKPLWKGEAEFEVVEIPSYSPILTGAIGLDAPPSSLFDELAQGISILVKLSRYVPEDTSHTVKNVYGRFKNVRKRNLKKASSLLSSSLFVMSGFIGLGTFIFIATENTGVYIAGLALGAGYAVSVVGICTEGHFGACGACLGAVLGGLGGYLCGGKTSWIPAGIGAVCGGAIGYKIGKNIKVNLEDTPEFCP
ncbi:hypothetical protein DRQ18_01190 [bacterium]|nr:MAG: hypothetical protein DRQ18_01190 [bacterium]